MGQFGLKDTYGQHRASLFSRQFRVSSASSGVGVGGAPPPTCGCSGGPSFAASRSFDRCRNSTVNTLRALFFSEVTDEVRAGLQQNLERVPRPTILNGIRASRVATPKALRQLTTFSRPRWGCDWGVARLKVGPLIPTEGPPKFPRASSCLLSS